MAEQKLYLNIQEQVEKNKNDIKFILEEEGVLNQFGIKVIGQEDTAGDMPSVDDYKEDNEDWAYGDAYAIGTEAPYSLYVLTRANGTHPNDYWFNIGSFPAPGPQGEQGPAGNDGVTPNIQAYAMASGLAAGASPTASVSKSGPDSNPLFNFSFGIPKGDTGATGAAGKPGAFHINGQVANASLLPDASLVDSDAAYAVGSVLPYDVYVIMTVEGVQSWLNIGPVLTEISDTYNIVDTYSTSGTMSQEQIDAIANDTNMNFLKIGKLFFVKMNEDFDNNGVYIYICIRWNTIYHMSLTLATGVWTISTINAVDLASAQTISGIKTFTNGIKVGDLTSAITSSNGITSIPSWLQINGNFHPSSDNDRNLGSSSKRWKELYLSGTAYLVKIDPNGNNTIEYDNNYTAWKFNSNIIPLSDNLRSIGASDKRIKDIYFAGILSDGVNSITVENIVKKTKLYTHTITLTGASEFGQIIFISNNPTPLIANSLHLVPSAISPHWAGPTNYYVVLAITSTSITVLDSAGSPHTITFTDVDTDTVTDF